MKQIYVIMFSVSLLTNITYSQTAESLPQARDSLEDFRLYGAAHCQAYDVPAKWDLPECACFDDTDPCPWPLWSLDAPMPLLARRSVGLQASCYQHRGKPYWELQLQYARPQDAHFAAHDRIWIDFLGRNILWLPYEEAWCSETVSWWHYIRRMPYNCGYFTNTTPSSILRNTKQVRNWYKHEENKGANGRGRWINGHQLRYGEFYTPGINAPCGGMYQQLEGYDAAKKEWSGKGDAHSQLIDSVVVYRDFYGRVIRIDVRVVEGNVSRDNVNQGHGMFNRSWIRNTKWYRDVMKYTTQGALFDGTRKIRGWGVMRDDGFTYCFNEVLYDPGGDASKTIVSQYEPFVPPDDMVIDNDDQIDSATQAQLMAFYTTTAGMISPSSNSTAVQLTIDYPDSANPWVIPPGTEHSVDTVLINVDLRAEHPWLVDGVILFWRGGYIPRYYELSWAGQDSQFHSKVLESQSTLPPPPTTLQFPDHIPFTPIDTIEHPDSGYAVRYLRIGIPKNMLNRTYEITGLCLRFFVEEEDNFGGSAESEITEYTVNSGWNMVSVPLKVNDYLKTSLYPTAVSNAFTYDNIYITKDTLVNNVGYWLKFSTAEMIEMSGMMRFIDTVDVIEGWNMIGALSIPISVDQVTSTTSGMVTSQFFGYNGGYAIVDTIEPSKGYWVKVNQNGQLILSSTGEEVFQKSITIVPTKELPPTPPCNDANDIKKMPMKFALEQNYPNPFNPVTEIKYAIPTEAKVKLKIYNVLGQEIITLLDEIQDAGFKSVNWDASDHPSGVYIYKLSAESEGQSFVDVKKVVLLR